MVFNSRSTLYISLLLSLGSNSMKNIVELCGFLYIYNIVFNYIIYIFLDYYLILLVAP